MNKIDSDYKTIGEVAKILNLINKKTGLKTPWLYSAPAWYNKIQISLCSTSRFPSSMISGFSDVSWSPEPNCFYVLGPQDL